MRPQIYREMKVLESDDLLTRSIIPTKRMPILNNTVLLWGFSATVRYGQKVLILTPFYILYGNHEQCFPSKSEFLTSLAVTLLLFKISILMTPAKITC